jgi:Carbohydrate-binding module 48 (Isoamylase N-terminal domain)
LSLYRYSLPLWGTVAATLLTSDAHAQRIQNSLDVGGVGIQYADTLSAVAATVTPHLVGDWGNRIADLTGTYSQLGADWSMQGQASGSVFTPLKFLVGELAGFVGGSAHRDGSRTGEFLLNGRVHAEERFGELFLGAGAGSAWFADEGRTMLLAEAGVSRPVGAGTVTLTLTPVTMGDSIRYADGQVGISSPGKNMDLDASAGVRFGDQLTSLGGKTRVWANATAAVWISSQAALVIAGGNYPIDPTQGFPGGRFVSLAIRLRYPRRNIVSPLHDSVEMEATAISFAIEKRDEIVTFKVLSPLARNVELAADFTEWAPQQMTRAGGGWWLVSEPLKPGKYEINLRVNGGKWVVPPGLLEMLDEFGGSVGLLVVD